MAKIETYDQRVLPQARLQAQASAADFGAGIGAAMREQGQAANSVADATQQEANSYTNAGNMLANVTDTIQRAENDQGRVWAANAVNNLQMQAQQELIKQSETADPANPDFKNFSSNFTSWVDEQGANVLQGAPNSAGAKQLQLHMAELRTSMFGKAASVQASLNGEYTKELVTQGMNTASDLVAQDPSNMNFAQVRQRQHDMVDGLETTSVNKMKFKAEIDKKLGMQQILTAASMNPTGFLSSVGLSGGVITPKGPAGGVPSRAPQSISDDEFTSMASRYGNQGFVNMAKAFRGQETNGGRDPSRLKENYAGAFGDMQVTRGTFDNLKEQGIIPADAQFHNNKDNTGAGLALLNTLFKQYGGDPAKVAAAYYAGPKAVGANGAIKIGMRDLKNPNAPTVGEYVTSVLRRLGPTDASAEAAGTPAGYVKPASDTEIMQRGADLEGWQHLDAAQKIQVVRMAEGLITKSNAGARAEIDKDLRDITSMLGDGVIPPGMDDSKFTRANLVSIYGEDKGIRVSEALGYQVQVAGAISSVNTMTRDQLEETIASLRPPAGEGYADKIKSYNAFIQAATTVDSARQKNPMEWAIQNNVSGAKPLPLGNMDEMAKELRTRVVAADNLVNNYGTKPQIVTKDEASAFSDVLDRAAPPDKIKMLRSVRSAFGNDRQGEYLYSVFNDQISAKTPMAAMAGNLASKSGVIATDSGTQTAENVAQYVLEGEYILRGGKLGDAMNTDKPDKLDDTVLKSSFNATLGNAFRNLDAQQGERARTEMFQAVKNYLAADLTHRGTAYSQAGSADIERAINAVSGGVWKRGGDTLMAPWGYSMDNFRNEFNGRAQLAIDAAGLKGTQLDRLDSYSVDNAGDGKYVLRFGGKYLVGNDGPVVIDYSKPMPFKVGER